jgi:transcriptional regulator with GAF, ATPase, and Fis domain
MKPKGIGVDRYKALADQGHTAPETARLLGVSKTTVQGMAKRHGIAFVHGIRGRKKPA